MPSTENVQRLDRIISGSTRSEHLQLFAFSRMAASRTGPGATASDRPRIDTSFLLCLFRHLVQRLPMHVSIRTSPTCDKSQGSSELCTHPPRISASSSSRVLQSYYRGAHERLDSDGQVDRSRTDALATGAGDRGCCC
jgi:hypothetical protein